jgi:hypothetical protein
MRVNRGAAGPLAAVVVVLCVVVSGLSAAEASSTGRVVVFDGTGDGSSRTSAFRLPDAWNLRWSFDCSSSVSGPGIFSVEVLEAGSPPRHDPEIPRLLRFATSGSGVDHYSSGAYRAFLRIASQCSWIVKAVRAPS